MIFWKTLFGWLGLWVLPPFLFLIGFGLISWMAFNSDTQLAFWIWVVIAYLFLAICLALYWTTLKKIINETRKITD